VGRKGSTKGIGAERNGKARDSRATGGTKSWEESKVTGCDRKSFKKDRKERRASTPHEKR